MARTQIRLGLLAAVTGLFLWLFLRQVDLAAALAAVAGLPSWAVGAALLALAANVGLVALRWRALLAAAGHRVEVRRLLAVYSAGAATSNVLPARAGDAVRLETLRSGDRVPGFLVAGTLFAERLLDGLVLSVWLLAGSLLLGAGGVFLLTGIALSSGSALGCALAALAALRPERAARGLALLGRVLPARLRGAADGAAAGFVAGLASFRPGRPLLVALAASAGVWAANLGLYAAVGVGLGLDVGLGGYLALEGVGNLALGVPATAAGVGSFDYLTLLAAGGAGVPEAHAGAFVLAVHALTVVPVTVAGLILLPRALPGRRVPAAERA